MRETGYADYQYYFGSQNAIGRIHDVCTLSSVVKHNKIATSRVRR